MKYERLTETKWTNDNCKPAYDKNGNIVMDKELFDLLITEHNRLAEYEDDEGSGKIVRLPCKVGDTVYWFTGIHIDECKVKGFSNCGDGFGLRLHLGFAEPSVSWALGKSLFFTRKEAEKRLKELQNG